VQTRTIILEPRQPFDFALTAGYLTYFRGTYAADRFEDGVYRRAIVIDDNPLLVSVRTGKTKLNVDVLGEHVGVCQAKAAAREIGWLLGCDTDLTGFYRIAEADGVLAPIVQKLYGLHPTRTASMYETLVLAVTGQQIAASVAAIIRRLLVEHLGATVEVDGTTYHIFPTPEAVLAAGMDGLRSLKLSSRKAEYILGIAAKSAGRELDTREIQDLHDSEVSKRLLAIRGVGPWTASWVLLRALGREDAFPSGDLALQRIMSRLYFGGRALSQEKLEEFSHRWSPYRSFVVVYVFAAARLGLLSQTGNQAQIGP
jgi:DNA-3-methyladenine glycosylase II